MPRNILFYCWKKLRTLCCPAIYEAFMMNELISCSVSNSFLLCTRNDKSYLKHPICVHVGCHKVKKVYFFHFRFLLLALCAEDRS